MARKATLILSDSVLARIRPRTAHSFYTFMKAGNSYVPGNLLQVGSYLDLDEKKKFGDLFQFAFSGWKIAEGLTQFHREEIKSKIGVTTTVGEIYLVIGINDLR